MNLRVMSAAALFMSAAYVGMISPATAADLGGDCCSDLEERVAELEATTARKGNRKVSLEVYGQVATGVMFFDNGKDSDTFIVDNANSPSRFGFKGAAKISPSLSAGFHIEVGAISAPSSAVTVSDDDGGTTQTGDGVLSLRYANWYLDHKSMGRLTVGRISAAMDGIQEIDLVGTNLVSLPGINVGNKIAINGGGVGTWADVMRGFDGDRVNGVRYDTPTYAGFQLSTSFSENDRYDVTLRYAGEFSGFRVAAGIGYQVGDDKTLDSDLALKSLTFDEVRLTSGSVSVLHVSSGLFATGFAGRREIDDNANSFDESNWGLRAGIAKNWFGIGNTVVFGEYNYFDNNNDSGREAEVWGASVIQNIDAAAMELFLSYKNYSVDAKGADDTNIVFSGARIKF
jgi:predicted porin